MCGLAGFAGAGDAADLDRMTDRLAHRGPDGRGVHIDLENRVFLGHRRLAIVDLAGGHQPMWNETDTVAIVFNGEIYNHEELREELVRRGHKFATDHSDTEVLVHGYEEWGKELPGRLNGMFAFAVFDKARGEIFLARDRFGEKPMYWFRQAGLFAFASELSAIALHGGVRAEINEQALIKYLAYGYLPAPHAIYKNAHKLPAGHWLLYRTSDASVTTGAYWRFRLNPDDALTDRDEPRLVEELRHLLSQATKRRLMSDVPIGVFLSGGLDSSAVLAAACEHVGENRIKTFTIGFNEPSYDESGPARTVAAHFGSDHQERILDVHAGRALMESVLPRLDEPLGDPSLIPTYMLSKFTREQVTVALSGDGGDELLAGYDPMLAIGPARAYARLVPAALHRLLRGCAEMLPRSNRNMSLDFKLRRTLTGLSYPDRMWGPVWMAPLDPVQLGELFGRTIRAEDVYSEAIDVWESGGGDHVDRMLEFFTSLYLQDNILTKVDRATMMCSLESRAIFLDNDLVGFCQRLPNRFKLRNGERKYLLRRALRGRLPDAILDRPKKGFGMPVASWLETTPAEPPMRPVPGAVMDVARRRWAHHRARKSDDRLFLWSWLSLQHALDRPRVAELREAA